MFIRSTLREILEKISTIDAWRLTLKNLNAFGKNDIRGHTDFGGSMLRMLFINTWIAEIFMLDLHVLNAMSAIMNTYFLFLVKGGIFAPPVTKNECLNLVNF